MKVLHLIKNNGDKCDNCGEVNHGLLYTDSQEVYNNYLELEEGFGENIINCKERDKGKDS